MYRKKIIKLKYTFGEEKYENMMIVVLFVNEFENIYKEIFYCADWLEYLVGNKCRLVRNHQKN